MVFEVEERGDGILERGCKNNEGEMAKIDS